MTGVPRGGIRPVLATNVRPVSLAVLAKGRSRIELAKFATVIRSPSSAAYWVVLVIGSTYNSLPAKTQSVVKTAPVRSSLTHSRASARRGLSDRELLDLVEGSQIALDRSTTDLFPILRQLRLYLHHRGELWDFHYANLHYAVEKRYLDTIQKQTGLTPDDM